MNYDELQLKQVTQLLEVVVTEKEKKELTKTRNKILERIKSKLE